MPDTRDLLVEIGTEELPPLALARLARAFNEHMHAGLESAGLRAADKRSDDYFYSPRRLAVRVREVAARQPDRIEERLGPAVAAAFRADGTPTPAAVGFARSCGVTVGALERRPTDKGERLAHVREVAGEAATELLPGIVRQALDRLPIPRRMRWGAGEAAFVRPVHWVVLLFGGKPVKGEILGVAAGAATRGHRFHHPGAIALRAAGDYERVLRKTGRVWPNDAAHGLNDEIAAQGHRAAAEVGGDLVDGARDSALVDEIAALVEWPVALVGGFDPAFLALPEEVIIAVLEGQQRYFPLRGKDGRLLAHFVAISNIESRDPDEVRRGNERVIRPRLADAKFFWESDRRTRLERRAKELTDIVFQEGLGSLADRTARIGALAVQVAPGVETAAVERAALLCKCDLVTAMVGEFPALQGVMGRYYALADGEPQAVAAAIGEHYLPQKADDPLPATPAGQRLAIADKVDAIAGTFALGRRPTGDKDPFALRRQALGVLRIALEAPLDIDLAALIAAAIALQPIKVEDPRALGAEIYAFFMDRLRGYYAERGLRGDLVDAVLALELARPAEIDARLAALAAFVEAPDSQALAAANKRTANILRGATEAVPAAADPARLADPAEAALHAALTAKRNLVGGLIDRRDYAAALVELAQLRAPVDAFFDNVLVMTEDPAVRINRLALLGELQALFGRIADWSRIRGD
jgi:glycyl-tRNA synthetase beta chain